MITKERMTQVNARINECLEKAQQHYPNHTFKRPTVSYDLTGTTAGTANYNDNHIRLNGLLLVANGDLFIHRTVAHEMAHLVDHVVHPENFQSSYSMAQSGRIRRTKRSLHGPTFHYIYGQVFGVENTERCHSYDVSAVRKTARYVYLCTCGCKTTVSVGPKHHAREQRQPGSISKKGHGRARLVFKWKEEPAPVGITAIAASATAPQPDSTRASNLTGSTKDIARTFFKETNARADFIAKCVSAGIKKTTAATYYQNFKSGVWK